MSLRTTLPAVAAVAACLTVGVSAASAGEITGNGKPITINGNSPCAFSGQEDLQWHPDGTVTRGVPAHSQNWGHTAGREGGANDTFAFGFEWGCNARDFGLKK
jgi:hypothetical protein